MSDLYSITDYFHIKCTGKNCRISGIIIVLSVLTIGVSLIPLIVTLGFYGGLEGKLVILSQGQTQIVEGKDSTFCTGLFLDITSKRTTVTLYRLSQFPSDADIDIGNYITENTIESCSAGRGYGRQCTVSNDPSSNYAVTISSGHPHESIRFRVNCHLAEGSIAGIIISILVVYLLFCAGLFVGILCCARCIDNKSKSSGSGDVENASKNASKSTHPISAYPIHHSIGKI